MLAQRGLINLMLFRFIFSESPQLASVGIMVE
jgi:hypothetical protein